MAILNECHTVQHDGRPACRPQSGGKLRAALPDGAAHGHVAILVLTQRGRLAAGDRQRLMITNVSSHKDRRPLAGVILRCRVCVRY